jgi:hypothetical protein
MKEFFYPTGLTGLHGFFSQLPEEAEKAQSDSARGFRFSLFFRKSENNLSCRSC